MPDNGITTNDPGPVPAERISRRRWPESTTPADPSRASVIATLHALGDWLRDNPDVPTPDSFTMTKHITTTDEPDEQTRAGRVLLFGAEHPGASVHETYADVFAYCPLFTTTADKLRVSYTYRAELDTYPMRKRYT